MNSIEALKEDLQKEELDYLLEDEIITLSLAMSLSTCSQSHKPFDDGEMEGEDRTMFDIQPVKTNKKKNEKEKRDLELWNAITTAVHLCGLNGEDVTAMSLETLKQLGRYDLLPPCER